MRYERDERLLRRCTAAYDRLAAFRSKRSVCKDFAYGRQWSQRVTLPDGRVMSEEDSFRSRGRIPLTNNLIRQLVKSIVGRWRYLRRDSRIEGGVDIRPEDIDARALEEFLISGCAIQRIEGDEATNISPNRVFFGRFSRQDAGDCRFLGVVHDMSLTEVIRRFSGGRPRDIAELYGVCRHSLARRSDFSDNAESDADDPMDCIRIIEVWQRRPTPLLRLHDKEHGVYAATPLELPKAATLEKIGRVGENVTTAGIDCIADIADNWEQTWMTTDGTVLKRTTLPEATRLPVVMRFYPMIDGEVHSLVEDVMSQQRYVNRLVMLMDEILDSAAKGILLYPSDQLPHGMTWRQLRELWSTPGSVIPFRRTSRAVMPVQISGPGNCLGATEMLRTQLKMFDDITGTTGATRGGATDANSADMIERETENAAISMLDMLASFEAFIESRDAAARVDKNDKGRMP